MARTVPALLLLLTLSCFATAQSGLPEGQGAIWFWPIARVATAPHRLSARPDSAAQPNGRGFSRR